MLIGNYKIILESLQDNQDLVQAMSLNDNLFWGLELWFWPERGSLFSQELWYLAVAYKYWMHQMFVTDKMVMR